MISRWIRALIRRRGYELILRPKRHYPYSLHLHHPQYPVDLWINDETGEAWYTNDCLLHPGELPELLRLVQPGDRVLEIGCHHGLTTCLLGFAVGPSGHVLGLDPVPRNAQVAQSQISLNRLGNTQVLHLAASDKEETLPMADSSCSSVIGITDPSALRIPAMTGDTLNGQYGPFNVLKVDVEGFEGKVLAGCRNLLRQRPRLALEIHGSLLGRYGTTWQEIWDLIGVEQYQGTMVLRHDSDTVRPFDRQSIKPDDLVNLHLWPV